MVTVRSSHTATLLPDGRVLVAGGGVGHEMLASAELYDAGRRSWTHTGGMLRARGGHTATLLLDGKVLVAGGYVWRGLTTALASAELYDPSSGRWTATGAMHTARNGHTATLLADGRVLVTGGYGSAHANPDIPLASAELYDPRSGTWTATGGMSEARYSHTATLLPDGNVLVAGGRTSRVALASAELYDRRSGTWTSVGEMSAGRYSHTATRLADGRVLVTGGSDILSPALASAELYDPRSRSWSTTGNMAAARAGHTATLLRDGTLLVAGGSSGPGSVLLSSAELYNPSSGSWTVTANMARPRQRQAATLLLDGTVLVVGGADSLLAAAELYRPRGTT